MPSTSPWPPQGESVKGFSVLLLAAAVLSTSAAAAPVGSAASRDDVLELENRLATLARPTLGERFGCVTIPGREDPSAELREVRLFVSSRSRRTRVQVRSILRRTGSSDIVRLRFTSPRYGVPASDRLRARLRRAVPPKGRDLVVITQYKGDSANRCPREVILVPTSAPDSVREWAFATEQVIGGDRVFVRVTDGPIPL
jgi:hypothetical protein